MPESRHSPERGDFTGRVATALKLARTGQPVQESSGVYDPKTGQLLDIGEEDAATQEYRPADDDGEVPERSWKSGLTRSS